MTASALLLLTLRVSGVVVLAGAASLLRRRAAAAERHWMWLIALGGVLMLPFATAILPAWRVVPLSARVVGRPTVAATALENDVHIASATSADRNLPGGPVPVAVVERAHARSVNLRNLDLTHIALALWLAGTLVYFVRLVRAHVQARAIVRVSRPWIKTTRDGRTFAIRQSELATSPFTYGVFKPTIIVPANAVEWPAARLDAVVNHEAAHVSRDDGLALLLAEATCAVYWWHPAVRYAGRQAAAECERACDDVVLRTGMLASDYGTQLLAQAQARSAWDARPLATIMFGRSDGLAARIGALLDPRIDRRPLRRSRALSAAAFGVGMMALLAAAAPLEKSVMNTPARALVAPTSSTIDALPVVPRLPIVPVQAEQQANTTRRVPITNASIAETTVDVAPAAPAAACVQADARQARTARFGGFTFTGAGGFITDQGATVIVWSGIDCVAWIRYRNPINVDSSWRAATVLFGGELTMHDDNSSIQRDYSLNSDGKPTLQLNGQPVAITTSDEAWIADMMREYVRRTGYGAIRRAGGFLARGGVPALLAEVGQIAQQDVRARYLQIGFDSVAEQNRAAFIHDGASLLDHAYSRGQFLLAVPLAWRTDERALAAVYAEAALIEPDDIVVALLRQTQPPRPVSPLLRPLLEKLIATLQSVDRRRGLGAYYLDVPP